MRVPDTARTTNATSAVPTIDDTASVHTASRRELAVLFASADPRATRVFAQLSQPTTSGIVVSTGAEALVLTKQKKFDFVFIDEELADTRGLEIARALRHRRHPTPFALFGNDLPTETTVEAMKLGASAVFNKPVTAHLIATATDTARVAATIGFGHTPNPRSSPRLVYRATCGDRPLPAKPRSTTDRWAVLVLRVCESDADLPTLAAWAAFVGLSYSSLSECCRLLKVHPRDARDFARLLRAVVRSQLRSSTILDLLSIGDRRTLQALLARGGLDRVNADTMTVEGFLAEQRFVAPDNPGLMALRAFLLR
jgi:ActR/RegA family two-component response regulator